MPDISTGNSPHGQPVRLVFPNQLFTDHLQVAAGTLFLLIEDDLFFRQYPFHKQKLILHRASMRHFADMLHKGGFETRTIEMSERLSIDVLSEQLIELKPKNVSYYEVVDDWLQRALDKLFVTLNIQAQRLESPSFLTSLGLIDDYFSHNPNRMQQFYEWQRKRLDVLMDNNKPVGGKYSFDVANRRKLPKDMTLPPAYSVCTSQHVVQAQHWVDEAFSNNPGNSQTFDYPVTHAQAAGWLEQFLAHRLVAFGPYEDAIAKSEGQVFHSVLSSSLNIGLLTPRQVLDAVLAYADKHTVPIESLEGFVRQIIGWREYMRATYVQFGSKMRTGNRLNCRQPLKPGWWDGTVGLEPIDTVIKRVLQTGYAHHIERLMILGNSMLLLRIHPDAVYEWFMVMFIDAYDWVMVPNVYAMSQFAAGTMITTKPYISGSNYIIKMSDYKKTDWSAVWDALYWKFIDDYRNVIKSNYRLGMVVGTYERFTEERKDSINTITADWL